MVRSKCTHRIHLDTTLYQNEGKPNKILLDKWREFHKMGLTLEVVHESISPNADHPFFPFCNGSRPCRL